MKTTDLFKNNRSSKKINESLQKTFGRKLNLENFDLEQLQDARNKLRTQVSQVRSESGFNENLENEAFTEAQWMLDAINAEIADREEHIVNATVSEDGNGFQDEFDNWMHSEYAPLDDEAGDDNALMRKAMAFLRGMVSPNQIEDAAEILVNMYYGQNESVAMEKAPPGGKYERMVKHIKKGYAKDGKLTDKEKSIAYATAWKAKNKANESIESGENMTKLREGEIQQAQSIVSAKTMVDRVGRWIEELSGMENDNLLQLGDQIRDEMGQEQAKSFISTVAPAIQQALENLKQTRETLSTGVRILTGEEQPAEMLGAEPVSTEPADEFGPAEPDAMNDAPEDELGAAPEDEFGAADAAAGGLEAAGRAKRESIDYGNRLMRVLAG